MAHGKTLPALSPTTLRPVGELTHRPLLAPPSAARPVAVIFGVIALLWVFVVVVVVATGFWWLALIGTFVAAFPWGVILASHREENRSHGGTTITHTSGGAR